MKKKHYRKLLKDAERRRSNIEQRNKLLTEKLADQGLDVVKLSSLLLIAKRNQEVFGDLKPVLRKIDNEFRELWKLSGKYAVYSYSQESEIETERRIAGSWAEILSILDWEDR